MKPQQFVEEYGLFVDERATALFIGAGLSIPAGYPSWPTLLKPLLAELELSQHDNTAKLAQYYQDNLPGGRERLEHHVINTIESITDADPTPVHRLLAELPIDAVWTTNYDCLLEASLPGSHAVTSDDQLAGHLASRRDSVIYKMHGSVPPATTQLKGVKRDARIVISEDDFDRYPTTRGPTDRRVRSDGTFAPAAVARGPFRFSVAREPAALAERVGCPSPRDRAARIAMPQGAVVPEALKSSLPAAGRGLPAVERDRPCVGRPHLRWGR